MMPRTKQASCTCACLRCDEWDGGGACSKGGIVGVPAARGGLGLVPAARGGLGLVPAARGGTGIGACAEFT